MPDIVHRFEAKASAKDTYNALSSLEGLSGWWTTDTQGNTKTAGTIEFRFGTRGRIDMKVLESEPARRVLWQVIAGPEEWIGTKVAFNLREQQGITTVLFEHQGWKAQTESMHACSTKWATFLLGLKSLLEAGKGTPFPNDVRVTCSGD
jgi:uncharacterized protein YndB with AHSA1/START domain